MASLLLTISSREEDLQLSKEVAGMAGFRSAHSTDVNEIRRYLVDNPGTAVLWDGQESLNAATLAEFLPKYVKTSRIFVVTDLSLGNYPHLLKYPVFGHHLFRRYAAPAAEFYSKLLTATYNVEPAGLAPYFSRSEKIRRIPITKSGQKRAAIEALQNVLTTQGVQGRLAGIVAQASDELILNAIFDAPVSETGRKMHHAKSRETELELSSDEAVTVEFAASSKYMGICVTDQFGSLDKVKLYRSLNIHFQPVSKASSVLGPSTGFGLHGILQSGLNLLLISQPKRRTDAMIFFPIVQNFRDFRTSFRFFSLLSTD